MNMDNRIRKEEETIDMSIEKFSGKDLEELIVLSESFKQEIQSKEEHHWFTKLQKRTKYDLYNIILKTQIISAIIGAIGTLSVFTLTPKVINMNYMGWIIVPSMALIIIPSMLITTLEDGTNDLKRKLRAVEILIDKKQPHIGKKIMMDTNIFNKIAEGILDVELLEKAKTKGYIFYITHIQSDEISSCKEEEKRKKLVLFMAKISPKLINTESLVWGKSRWGFSKWGKGELFEKLKEGSDNPKRYNDYIIAETAIKNDFVLLTEDDKLRSEIHRFCGRAISKEDFLENIR